MLPRRVAPLRSGTDPAAKATAALLEFALALTNAARKEVERGTGDDDEQLQSGVLNGLEVKDIAKWSGARPTTPV